MNQNTLTTQKSNSSLSIFSFKRIVLASLLYTITVGFSYMNAQCTGTLEVQKNRSFQSATSKRDATFKMSLKNTSSQSGVFRIKTENISKTCANTTFPSKAANVELKASVLSASSDKVAGRSVKLAAGETYEFLVNVNVPPNTAIERWSCIEVTAVADNCRTAISGATLSVYVANPEDSE